MTCDAAWTLVGIVVVSHSRALGRRRGGAGAGDGAGRTCAIEVAAGLDETTFGTDAVAIAEAIGAADSGAGVVVLMDLGSAVLSAELALDLLDDPDARDRVLLCPAPLVEGLVVAAVTAAGGAGRAEVAAEAAAALGGKQAQLGGFPDTAGSSADGGAVGAAADREEPSGAELTAEFTVVNPHGLHARPAARLVALVRDLDGADVRVRNATTGSPWIVGREPVQPHRARGPGRAPGRGQRNGSGGRRGRRGRARARGPALRRTAHGRARAGTAARAGDARGRALGGVARNRDRAEARG